MQQICDKTKHMGCKSMIDVGANDGYVDLSVETGNVEYSFAYFYYNPQICEPYDQYDMDFEEENEEFSEFNELVLAETSQQQKPVESMKKIEFSCDINDLYKFL